MKTHDFAIVGGGICGLTTAVAMIQSGFTPHIFESAPLLKPVGAGILLSPNAMKALDKLGLADKIIETGHVPDRMSILSKKGTELGGSSIQDFVHGFGFPTVVIHRADLLRILLEPIPKNYISLGKNLVGIEQNPENITLQFEDQSTAIASHLIAADGIHSVVRKVLLPDAQPRYAGYTCWRGVTDQLPPGFDDSMFTETWGPQGRMGIAPLGNGKVYWFLCMDASEKDSAMMQKGPKELAHIFRDYHFPIPQLLAVTPSENIILNDIIDLSPLPTYVFSNAVLSGDAAHATTPNLGQGACQSIEDAVVLASCLEKFPEAKDAFKEFERRRMGRTQKVVNLSERVGKIAQIENPFLCGLRNLAMRLTPNSVNQSQTKWLFDISF